MVTSWAHRVTRPGAERPTVRSVDGTLRPAPVRPAQLALEHLARGRQRERVDDVHRAGRLVAGDPVGAEGAQVLQGDGATGDWDDDGVHALAPPLVGALLHGAVQTLGEVHGDLLAGGGPRRPWPR